jgi:hypothetical protein
MELLELIVKSGGEDPLTVQEKVRLKVRSIEEMFHQIEEGVTKIEGIELSRQELHSMLQEEANQLERKR